MIGIILDLAIVAKIEAKYSQACVLDSQSFTQNQGHIIVFLGFIAFLK